MRDTNDLQTTITLGPVNCVGQTLSLELGLQMALPMPNQDEHLPDQIEAFVHQGGLEIEPPLSKTFVEKADQELVLQRRQGKGGTGIRLRGTRPFTFKATFGEVTVRHPHQVELPKRPTCIRRNSPAASSNVLRSHALLRCNPRPSCSTSRPRRLIRS